MKMTSKRKVVKALMIGMLTSFRTFRVELKMKMMKKMRVKI